MNAAPAPGRLVSRSHRSVYLAGYLLIFSFGLRRLTELEDPFQIRLATVLLVAFGILYAAQAWLSERHPRFLPLYFGGQMLLVLALIPFEEYLDNWCLLYILLSWQAAIHLERGKALAWIGVFSGAGALSLALTFGPLSGVGRGAAYFAIGLFLIAFDSQYALSQDAQAESQALLSRLQAAHQALQQAAEQNRRLAVLDEHARISAVVHASVGMQIDSIHRGAGAAGALLEDDLPQAIALLEWLQGETQTALAKMRGLIGRLQQAPPTD